MYMKSTIFAVGMTLATSLMLSACDGATNGATNGASNGAGTPMNLAGSEWGTGADLPFIKFSTGGKVMGNGSCNNFSGTYSTDGNKLTFSPLKSTKRACPNLDVEYKFMENLAQTRQYSATHMELVLADAQDKELMTLQRRDWD